MIKTDSEFKKFIQSLGEEGLDSLSEISKEYLQYLYGYDCGRNRLLFLQDLISDDFSLSEENYDWANTHLVNIEEQKFNDIKELFDFLEKKGFCCTSVFDGKGTDYITAVVGIDNNSGRVVYDFDEMVEYLLNQNSDDDTYGYTDALEWIDYNTIRSLPYFQNSPIIISKEQIEFFKSE